MAKEFLATVDEWVLKKKGALDLVLKRSMMDTMEAATETTIGKMRGGMGPVGGNVGKIPIDFGDLNRSLVSSVLGGAAIPGIDSYKLLIGGIKAKNEPNVYFSWTAEHAAPVHYGTKHMEGYFWVEKAAQKWKGFVKKNVEFARWNT